MGLPDPRTSKATEPGGTGTTNVRLHPLAIELLVNCADCGSLLNAELCSHDERPFSKQMLITVARCRCNVVADRVG